MRIVHVSDTFLPRHGGIESHVSDLAARQAAAGHEVHVVTDTPAGAAFDPAVHRLRGGWVRELVLGSLESTRSVLRLRPDVVHSHNSILSPLALNVACMTSTAGVPTAVTVHSLLPKVGPVLPLSGALLSIRGGRVAWSAVSEAAAGPVRRVLGSGTRVDVVGNAVDVAWWREQRSMPRNGDEVRVATVGRLATRKRVLPLVRMMARVRQAVPSDVRLRLDIVGDGPQLGQLRRALDARGMSSWVSLPGQLDRWAVRDVLAAADVYVAPARLESFGIAALEARCLGLPVVAHARSGITEFIEHGVDGMLVVGDRAMSDALAELVSTPALRDRIRLHNVAVAPRSTWDSALLETDRLYARAGHLAVGHRGLRPSEARTVKTS
jgi:glycosyltransferase involved in cell wall biosynthesis